MNNRQQITENLSNAITHLNNLQEIISNAEPINSPLPPPRSSHLQTNPSLSLCWYLVLDLLVDQLLLLVLISSLASIFMYVLAQYPSSHFVPRGLTSVQMFADRVAVYISDIGGESSRVNTISFTVFSV